MTLFLLTCHEFSSFSQSGEGPGNNCCVRQLVFIAIIYFISNMSITKSRFNRFNLFFGHFLLFGISVFLITCHQFSPVCQSGERPGNNCCVRQLTVIAIFYLISPKACYKRTNFFFLHFLLFGLPVFLLKFHEFSLFSQSGEGTGNVA